MKLNEERSGKMYQFSKNNIIRINPNDPLTHEMVKRQKWETHFRPRPREPFVIAIGSHPNPTYKKALKCEHKESICTRPPLLFPIPFSSPPFPSPFETKRKGRRRLWKRSSRRISGSNDPPDYRSTSEKRVKKEKGEENRMHATSVREFLFRESTRLFPREISRKRERERERISFAARAWFMDENRGWNKRRGEYVRSRENWSFVGFLSNILVSVPFPMRLRGPFLGQFDDVSILLSCFSGREFIELLVLWIYQWSI